MVSIRCRRERAEPVQPPDHEGVAGANERESLGEARAFGGGDAGHVGEDAAVAGFGEGVLLQGEGLIIGKDTGVPDLHMSGDCLTIGQMFHSEILRMRRVVRHPTQSEAPPVEDRWGASQKTGG